MTTDFVTAFLEDMRQKNCAPDRSSEIGPTGRWWRRFTLQNDPPTKKNGSYKLEIMGNFAVGFFCNHRDGITHKFFSNGKTEVNEFEMQIFQQRLEKKRRDDLRNQEKEYRQMAEKCESFFYSCPRAGDTHPYLELKKIKAHNIRQYGMCLIVPYTDINGKIWSFQRIWPDGKKKYEKGAKVSGCFHGIWKDEKRERVVVCEGYSTGSSIHEATALPVLCAGHSGNLIEVAKAVRRKYKDADIILACDHDQWSVRPNGELFNAGLHFGTRAAAACQGAVVYPPFPIDDPGRRSDFNDFAQAFSKEKLKDFFI